MSWWKKLVWRGAEDAPSRRRTAEAPVARAEAPGGEVGPADAVLAGVVVALIAFGVVMVYSASAVYASQRYGDGQHFLIRQGVACPAQFLFERRY